MADKKTGKMAAAASSDVLKDDRTGKKSKTAAGSALSQTPGKGKTGKKYRRRTGKRSDGEQTGNGRADTD